MRTVDIFLRVGRQPESLPLPHCWDGKLPQHGRGVQHPLTASAHGRMLLLERSLQMIEHVHPPAHMSGTVFQRRQHFVRQT